MSLTNDMKDYLSIKYNCCQDRDILCEKNKISVYRNDDKDLFDGENFRSWVYECTTDELQHILEEQM